jgi:hypothetical protein
MKLSPITGGCCCGKVRYRASGPNLRQTNCHCANCRRAAGAQSVAWITVKRSEFAFEKGEPKRYKTDTGLRVDDRKRVRHSTKLMFR